VGYRLRRGVDPEDAASFLGGVVIVQVDTAEMDSTFAELPAGISIRPAI